MIEFYDCATPCYRCDATAWEHVGEFVPVRGPAQDVLECAFCGVRHRVDAPRRPRATAAPTHDGEEFRFQFGRFAGLTFAEVDAEPNGRRYLEHLRSTNERLRDRIAAYLDSTAASSA